MSRLRSELMADSPELRFYGIRHHGPGSAAALRQALDEWEPDCLLVEGPTEGEEVIAAAADPAIRPPVALLTYAVDRPSCCAFFPYAVFSPEWQAIQWALARSVPLRFMDLPQVYQLADAKAAAEAAESVDEESVAEDGMDVELTDEELAPAVEAADSPDPGDPLDWFGRSAGFIDGEDWWEHMVEQRRDSTGIFEAVAEVMGSLRNDFPPRPRSEAFRQREGKREAWMRRVIRETSRQAHERIAVICGAWHVPALQADDILVKDDNELLKGMSRTRVQATWVPWMYGRLSTSSGYGAGVLSPGWYHHLWQTRQAGADGFNRTAAGWLTRVAHLLREKGIDCSSAHVIEAVRLAETLAALRRRPIASLPELNDAVCSVMCFGDDTPLRLIHEQLIVGDRLGEVPTTVPTIPLQQDLDAQQRSLRLKPQAGEQTVDLDLRKPIGLGRSQLLHRLLLLGIQWGRLHPGGQGKGTFHELWTLRWKPELTVQLIEASIWGSTIEGAATARAIDRAEKGDLPTLAKLLEQVLLAELPEVVPMLTRQLEDRAAGSGDVLLLMSALPPLVTVSRYGNVRQTDTAMLDHVINGLVARICVGLAPGCSGLAEDAAKQVCQQLDAVDEALHLLQDEGHLASWHEALGGISGADTLPPALTGRTTRMLLEAVVVDSATAGTRMRRATSRSQEPQHAAAWLEGFLRGSGMILLHDKSLWSVIDDWLCELQPATFTEVLPLVRRAFAFPPAERQEMGRRVRQGRSAGRASAASAAPALDPARAERVLPLVCTLLGLED